MKLGLLPLGRPTFDVPFAESKLAAMLSAVDACGYEVVGARTLLFDEAATLAAIENLKQENVDQVLILQVTFTDASMAVAAANAFTQPLSIWAVPEPREGGRLRLNAFCGLNLAAHALGLNDRAFSWLYADPDGSIAPDLAALLSGERPAGKLDAGAVPSTDAKGEAVAAALKGRRIARIGEHPEGFDTCAYDPKRIDQLAGVEVEALELETLFDTARQAEAADVAVLRQKLDSQVPNADDVDKDQLDRSLRLKLGLDSIRNSGAFDAFAIRCWPETFTVYGGAVCGPAAMMGEAKVPCACEADVYGALTQLLLMEAAQAPVFLTDLVDVDCEDGTAVVWHCGQAPLSMCDPAVKATATVHTNRKQPLLYQFPLKPGEVTLVRVSQSFNEPKLVLSYGEMLARPAAYTGTSGVMRFDRPASDVLADLIASGLEHHMALAYGDHRQTLRAAAGALDLPLLEI
ncbi:L-fucose/L-arabinose isomerase family protein [Roseibium sp.]|uniref:L-fucose/L-arabinose isomerase family protein n=1 Tax=Roseibium sp. TaxID=1936156 RepID=UPI003B52F906